MSTKIALLEAFRQHLLGLIVGLEQNQAEARAGMRVDGVHRPSNRGERAAVTSQGYLAQALEQRLAEVRSTLDLLEHLDPAPRQRAVTGALVQVEDEQGQELTYLLLPGGQGAEVHGPGGPVRVLSPDSPLGRAMWSLVEGDTATVQRGGRSIELEIIEIS